MSGHPKSLQEDHIFTEGTSMHEHGIADRLLAEALVKARGRGLKKIGRIVVGIGALSGLDKESLWEPLRHAADESGLQGVSFTFERIEPEAVCRKCGKGIGAAYQCPHCGGDEIEVTGGTEVVVMEVEG